MIEHLAQRGSGSPLHVHHREDEWFYVVDGELTIWVVGQVINAPTGSFVYSGFALFGVEVAAAACRGRARV